MFRGCARPISAHTEKPGPCSTARRGTPLANDLLARLLQPHSDIRSDALEAARSHQTAHTQLVSRLPQQRPLRHGICQVHGPELPLQMRPHLLDWVQIWRPRRNMPKLDSLQRVCFCTRGRVEEALVVTEHVPRPTLADGPGDSQTLGGLARSSQPPSQYWAIIKISKHIWLEWLHGHVPSLGRLIHNPTTHPSTSPAFFSGWPWCSTHRRYKRFLQNGHQPMDLA